MALGSSVNVVRVVEVLGTISDYRNTIDEYIQWTIEGEVEVGVPSNSVALESTEVTPCLLR